MEQEIRRLPMFTPIFRDGELGHVITTSRVNRGDKHVLPQERRQELLEPFPVRQGDLIQVGVDQTGQYHLRKSKP